MKEHNKLTRRLLAAGYTPEDMPPGTCEYKSYYGGWTYTSDKIRSMVFETPCGLLVHGSHFLTGYMSSHGVDWRPENDNPVVACPRFADGPCQLRHPLLHAERYSCHSDDVIYQCNCHPTDRPYTFEGSLDEAHKQVWQEAEEKWALFQAAHKGRVCRNQSRYGRTAKAWSTRYDPISCTESCLACTHCNVLDKDIVSQKGNVFYDVKKTWIEKADGLFPAEQRTSIEKGVKLLEKTVSMTICEAIVQYDRKYVEERIANRYLIEMHFDPSLKVELLNLRAARMNTRDIQQDLRDIANGIQVVHAQDSLKAAKAQKKARRESAKKRRISKVEKVLLSNGWHGLDDIWRRRAEKLLGAERIDELDQQWEKSTAQCQQGDSQIILF